MCIKKSDMYFEKTKMKSQKLKNKQNIRKKIWNKKTKENLIKDNTKKKKDKDLPKTRRTALRTGP